MTDKASEIVFVTGATSGFGAATARLFAKDGARVIVSGRRVKRLEALKKELKRDTDAHTLELDVRDRKAVDRAVAGLPKPFRAVTILINNAGLALGMAPGQIADPEDWETMVDTNIKGVMYCTRAILPGMVERKRGHIVNLGSVAGTYPYPGGHVYAGTKAFVHQFSLALRSDLLGTNVRVTSVEPGMCETEFSLVRFRGDEKKAGEVYRGMKPLSAEDVGEIIHWCATRPPHVNINRIEIMPAEQAFGAFKVHRKE